MRRTLFALSIAVLVAGAVVVAGASTSTKTQADLSIRHAMVGCHDWSLNGGPFRASQTLVLREGHSFTVTNRDNCAHSLVQVAGPEKALAGEKVVEPLGASVRVPLLTPGTYTFTTAEHGDLAYGTTEPQQSFGFGKLTSTGLDNVLTLKVHVVADRAPTE